MSEYEESAGAYGYASAYTSTAYDVQQIHNKLYIKMLVCCIVVQHVVDLLYNKIQIDSSSEQ